MPTGNELHDAEAFAAAQAALTRLRRDARAAEASVAQARQALGGDVFGRVVVEAAQQPDAADLADLVQLARDEYPQHELLVTIIARRP